MWFLIIVPLVILLFLWGQTWGKLDNLKRAIFFADKDTNFIKRVSEKNQEEFVWRKIERFQIYHTLDRARRTIEKKINKEPENENTL